MDWSQTYGIDKFKNFDLYKLLDFIHRLKKDKPLLGSQSDPDREIVKIKSHVTWGHQSSAIHSVHFSHKKVEIEINCFGLSGVYGPLPDAHTEFIIEKIKEGDNAILDFLDIFNHRFVSLLYQNYRRGTVHTGSTDPLDNFVGYILHCFTGLIFLKSRSLFSGINKGEETPQQGTTEDALSGVIEGDIFPMHEMFWKSQKSSSGLLRVLKSYFKCPVEIALFQGDWVYAPEDALSLLGVQNVKLGYDCVLGHRSWNASHGIEVIFGPLSFERYLYFIPPRKKGFEVLKKIFRYWAHYSGVETSVRVTLKLDPHEASFLYLDKDSYLGYKTWLITRPSSVKEFVVSFMMDSVGAPN